MAVLPTNFQLPALRFQQQVTPQISQAQPVSLGAVPGFQKWWSDFLAQQAAIQQQNAQWMHNLGPFSNALTMPKGGQAHLQALQNFMQSNPLGSYAPPNLAQS